MRLDHVGQKEKAIMMVREKSTTIEINRAFVHSTRIQIAFRIMEKQRLSKNAEEAERKSNQSWRKEHPASLRS